MNGIDGYLSLVKESLNIDSFTLDMKNLPEYSQAFTGDPASLFLKGPAMQLLLENYEWMETPVLLSAELGVYYLIARKPKSDTVIALGPFLSAELSEDSIDRVLDSYHVPLGLKRQLFTYLQSLPLIRINEIYPYGIMLHYLLTGRRIERDEIDFLTSGSVESSLNFEEKISRKRIYQAERSLLSFIENGIMNYREALGQSRGLSYGVRMNTGNPLRQNKNNIIVFTTLACRAAIRGGLSPEIAYTKNDEYITRAEQASTTSELSGIANEMFDDFIILVNEVKQMNLSPFLKDCFSYLKMHLKEKNVLSNMANELGYTESYLLRKFKKEYGTSAVDVLQSLRLKEAELLIRTTEMYLEEIAEVCGFFSETYFSTCFRKQYGLSPKEYRKRNIL